MVQSQLPYYRFTCSSVNAFSVARVSDALYCSGVREKTLQDRLKQARKRAGLSQSAVAATCRPERQVASARKKISVYR